MPDQGAATVRCPDCWNGKVIPCQVARLENEVSRRDVILDWLRANTPRSLELCPYKMGEARRG